MNFELFYKLMIGHALADIVLQPPHVSKNKNWNNKPLEELPKRVIKSAGIK